jgi:hypothetical protein
MKDTSKPEDEMTLDFFDEFEEKTDDFSPAEVEDETTEGKEEEEKSEEEVGDTEEEETEESEETEDDKTTETDEDTPLIKSLTSSFGYEFEEEFEDTEEGITALVRSAAEKMADEHLSAALDAVPEMKEFYEFVQLGGDPKKFVATKFPDLDYTSMQYDEDNEAQHVQLVRAEMKLRGYADDYIEQEIDDYKNGGILDNKAKRALTSLKQHQQETQSKLLEEQAKEKDKLEKEAAVTWNTINKTIKESKSIKGIQIPEKDKASFFDYISKPVKDGKSQRMLDAEEVGLEERLFIDYLLYSKFAISNIIDKKAQTSAAKSLRDRLGTKKAPKQGSSKPAKKGDPSQLADVHDII